MQAICVSRVFGSSFKFRQKKKKKKKKKKKAEPLPSKQQSIGTAERGEIKTVIGLVFLLTESRSGEEEDGGDAYST